MIVLIVLPLLRLKFMDDEFMAGGETNVLPSGDLTVVFARIKLSLKMHASNEEC